MNDDMRCLMNLCRAGFLRIAPPPPPEKADMTRVISLSAIHKVSALAAETMLEYYPISEDERGAAKAMLDSARYLEAMQRYETVGFTDRLSEAGIPYCMMKGWHLRELYPAPYDRNMSDVDMLARLSDWDRIQSVAEACGFSRSDEREIDLHSDYFKGDVRLEVHRSILSGSGLHEGSDKRVWDTLVPAAAPCEWRLSPTDEYIYFLLHAEKHTASFAFLLRTLIDIYALRTRGPEIDRARFEREAKRLGILRYAENLEALSEVWMRGETLSEEQEETLDFLLSLATLPKEETKYRTVKRWLQLNLSPAGLFRRLIVSREQLFTRFRHAQTSAEVILRGIRHAAGLYKAYIIAYFKYLRRVSPARRRELSRSLRRLYQ